MIHHLSTHFSSSVVYGISQLQALVTWSFFCYLIETDFLMAIASAVKAQGIPHSGPNISAHENRYLTWCYEETTSFKKKLL